MTILGRDKNRHFLRKALLVTVVIVLISATAAYLKYETLMAIFNPRVEERYIGNIYRIRTVKMDNLGFEVRFETKSVTTNWVSGGGDIQLNGILHIAMPENCDFNEETRSSPLYVCLTCLDGLDPMGMHYDVMHYEWHPIYDPFLRSIEEGSVSIMVTEFRVHY